MLKKEEYGSDENEDDASIYSKSAIDSMLEDDELTPVEGAFMNGYEDAI